MNLRTVYQKHFLREKIDREYLQKYDKVRVLGEKFIGRYYVVIFEALDENKKNEVYILVENHKKLIPPINLRTSKNDWGYIISKQHKLKILPDEVYNHLMKNGILEKLATVENEGSSTISIHRLVLSLYDNCFMQKVHHINRNRNFNPISNLVKMEKSMHRKTHKKYNISYHGGVLASLKEQNKLKRKLANPKRFSNAENHANVIKILEWSIQNERKSDRKENKK